MDRLDRLPVPKPNHVLSRDARAKRSFDKVLDLPLHLRSRVTRIRVILDGEFDPDYQMNDILINAVWPVVVEDLVVVVELKGCSSCFKACPA